jgi:hypothetical protein
MAVNLTARSESYAGYKIKWGIQEYVFSAQGTDLDHNLKADDVNGSGFGTQFENNLPGMINGTLKISGLAAMKRNKVSWLLNNWFGRTSPVNMWYATEGLDALSPVAFQPSSVMENSVKGKLKDSVTFDVSLSARGASNPVGVILVSPKSATQLVTTGAGLVDDNGTGNSTSAGGALVMHVMAVTAGTTPTVVMKVQHSPDGTTFTDLGTFTTVTATNATGTWVQRIELPSTTTINSQVKASWVTTGTPTEVQALVAIARGVDLDA